MDGYTSLAAVKRPRDRSISAGHGARQPSLDVTRDQQEVRQQAPIPLQSPFNHKGIEHTSAPEQEVGREAA